MLVFSEGPDIVCTATCLSDYDLDQSLESGQSCSFPDIKDD